MADMKFTVRDRRAHRRYFIDNALLRGGWGAAVGPFGIAVYNALCIHADADSQESWPSYETIAQLTGMSRRQAIRKMAQLETLQLIAKEMRLDDAGDQTSNTYALLDVTEWLSPEVVTHSHHPGDSQSLPVVTDSHPNNTQLIKTHETKLPTPAVSPPPCFPEQFTTSIKDIQEQQHTRGEWLAILEAEEARDGDARKGLVKWLKSKLHGAGHPAIKTFQDEMETYPHRNTYKDIIETVGNGDLELWRVIVRTWKLKGWNPYNVGGMLDCYRRRVIPGNGSETPKPAVRVWGTEAEREQVQKDLDLLTQKEQQKSEELTP